MTGRFTRSFAGIAAMALIAAGAPLLAAGSASGPTDADLMGDAASTGDVLTYGMGPQNQRFSPLTALNTQTVSKLVPAFAASLGGEKQRGQESQPLVYDGMIYVTGSYSRIYAFDARTGEQKWRYEARLPDDIMPCCDVVNRGAAIHGDKIIFATLDARLVALNRLTGKVVWNKQIADYKAGYSATAAPLIVRGMVITGNSGGEFGVTGAVDARNVDTGELIWHRPVIEGNMGTL
ncbi:MAG: PQQ-binding-like beta-propeller repeat protein, partial [bacterium]|nr:PQQ-binding-like beta-propeller repeat protein [bacterium]